MLNSSDAHSILGGASTSAEEKPKLPAPPLKISAEKKRRSVGRPAESRRPDGVSRELFNLINVNGIDVSSMLPASNKAALGYRNPKAQIGMRRARAWKWVEFANEGRTDGLRLHHWQRIDRLDSTKPYCFARFNKVINIPTYTDEEYTERLQVVKWSREETDYLFEMCRRFDIRWPVIVSQYDRGRFGKPGHTMEEMKERFYSIVSELNIMKDPEAEHLNYDAEHEKRRKEQLIKQWDRTPEEVEEEERLQIELRKIEARRREREKKAQELQKLISMSDKPPISPHANGPGMSPAPGKKNRPAFRQKAGQATALASNVNYIPTESGVSLRFSEFRSSGAHLRTQEMKLPTNIGQKKLKNIDNVIAKLKLDANPMGSEELVQAYNEFRSQIVVIQELKAHLQTAEYDLESLRTKGQFEIEPRMRISTLAEDGLDDSEVSAVVDATDDESNKGRPVEEGMATSRRRICSWIDLSTPNGVQSARKRKLPPTPGVATPSTSGRF